MKCVTQTDKKNKKKIIVSFILGMFAIILCAGCICFNVRERNTQTPEERQDRKLKKLFRENEDDLRKFIELSRKSILGKEKYIIMFDDYWYYSSSRADYEKRGWIPILYDGHVTSGDNGNTATAIEKNDNLMAVLSSIKEKGVVGSIIQTDLEESMRIVKFGIREEVVPVISSNSTNDFIYCENVDYERYEYRSITDDWYTYIDLNMNGLGMRMEVQYIEFEKLFRENKDDMQSFIDLSDESILEEAYVIVFDERVYSGMRSGYKKEWITILYKDNTFVIDDDKELEKNFNKKDDLIKLLNSIIEKKIFIDISLKYPNKPGQKIVFTVDPEFTPFITTNNGITNNLAYCYDNYWEEYGYRNIEENWYMYITPAPE